MARWGKLPRTKTRELTLDGEKELSTFQRLRTGCAAGRGTEEQRTVGEIEGFPPPTHTQTHAHLGM